MCLTAPWVFLLDTLPVMLQTDMRFGSKNCVLPHALKLTKAAIHAGHFWGGSDALFNNRVQQLIQSSPAGVYRWVTDTSNNPYLWPDNKRFVMAWCCEACHLYQGKHWALYMWLCHNTHTHIYKHTDTDRRVSLQLFSAEISNITDQVSSVGNLWLHSDLTMTWKWMSVYIRATTCQTFPA